MNFDILEEIDGTLVHHGAINNRVYFTDVNNDNLDKVVSNVNTIASKNNYDKIIGKVPEWGLQEFLVNGFNIEAKIPNLFKNTTGYFISGYLNKKRKFCSQKEVKIIESVKTIALAANTENEVKTIPSKLNVKKLKVDNLGQLGNLHKLSFKTYPFPIWEMEYLKNCILGNYEFYGVFMDENLIASAMVKIDSKESNAEVVDFAIHPNHRGQNLSFYLLQKIKKAIVAKGINTLFAIIRATSYGLNITFSKQNFIPAGTLIHNTLVDDTLENMNVWYIHLNKELK